MIEVIGMLDWKLKQDSKYYRTYTVDHLVRTDDPTYGPQSIANAPGLPIIGSPWVYGKDIDPWVWCSPEIEINQVVTGEKNTLWIVQNYFTNNTDSQSKCDTEIQNPLMQFPEVSGSFVDSTREATKDYEGNPLWTSSFERMRGPLVEVEDARPEINISFNTTTLEMSTYVNALHKRNLYPMWGLEQGMVKLSTLSFKCLYYGKCLKYYNVSMGFRVDFDKWVRYIQDEGTRVLKPGGNKDNPKDFVVAKNEATDEPFGERIPLNGEGQMLGEGEEPFYHEKQLFPLYDLLSLGVPASL